MQGYAFVTAAALAAWITAASPAAAATNAAQLENLRSNAHQDAAGRLQIDVHFDCTLAAPLQALTAAGLTVTSTLKAGTLCVAEGWALPRSLAQLDDVSGVIRLTPPSYAPPRPPRALSPRLRELVRPGVQKAGSAQNSINQNGVSIMRADQFVSQTATNGAGVTVGVQSVGSYSLNIIQARGELPGSIQVFYPAGTSVPTTADEGTALMEEIYAVAPGANLAFCGPSTFVDFTSCLTQLISAGATIVVDDIGFYGDGVMSQDNDESSALTQILAANPGVLMLTSAGNNEGTYWEGNYSPVSASTTALPPLSCPANAGVPDAYVATFGSAASQTLTVSGYTTFPLLLAWADPPGQITSHFDVFVLAPGSTSPLGCFSSSSGSTNQIEQTLTLVPGTYTVVVASPDASAQGKFLKLYAGGDGLTTLSLATAGGLVSPQTMVPGVITVGAVNGSDGIGASIEFFSSNGPLSFQFPTPMQQQSPLLVAPDGISVDAVGTYFAGDLFPDGNFYGTSAAVPNAGAVAALLRGAFPNLTVAQVATALETGATALGGTVPDGVFGYGRVDAMGALATVPTPSISALIDQSTTNSATTSPQPFTVSGTGALHFSVSSSNTALVPNSVVSTGSPGVTVSSGCGTSTQQCTLSVTPMAGQAGTAVLTVSALDGANRPAATQMTLTSTSPAPAPAPSGSGSGSSGSSGGGSTGGSTGTSGGSAAPVSSSHGGGGGLQDWVLLALGTLVAWSHRRALYGARRSIKGIA